MERTPRSKAVDGRGLVPWRPWSPSGPSRPTPAEPLSPLSPGFPVKRIDIAVFRLRKASARRHGPRGAAWPWLFTDGRHTEAGPHGTGSVGCDTVTPATRLARVAAAVPWSSGVSGRRRWHRVLALRGCPACSRPRPTSSLEASSALSRCESSRPRPTASVFVARVSDRRPVRKARRSACASRDTAGYPGSTLPARDPFVGGDTREADGMLGAVCPPGADGLTPAFSWLLVSVSLSALSPADQCEARGCLRAVGTASPRGVLVPVRCP